MESCRFAVLIGRFQPFHCGHLRLFEHASSIAGHVIILVGSHNAPVSTRNPWTSAEREGLIRFALAGYDPASFSIVTISDSAYNFNDWVIRVQRKVESIAGEGTVALVGHYKDDTSYYLDYFPRWTLVALPMQAGGVSSTAVRTAYFEGRFDEVKPIVPCQVFEELLRWARTDTFKRLQEDHRYIREYRMKWETAPFPPTFVTADAVVMALGHVLLIRRKVNPGKGAYALPGGFVKTSESIEKACLRELREKTGLDIGYKELHGSIKMQQVFDHPLRDPRGRVITHAFMFELNVKELPRVKGGDDAAEALWYPLFRLEDNESLFFNDHAQIIKFFVNRMN